MDMPIRAVNVLSAVVVIFVLVGGIWFTSPYAMSEEEKLASLYREQCIPFPGDSERCEKLDARRREIFVKQNKERLAEWQKKVDKLKFDNQAR